MTATLCADGTLGHHFVIDTPAGPTSRGVCRKCEAERDFANSDEAGWVGNKPPGDKGFNGRIIGSRNGKVSG